MFIYFSLFLCFAMFLMIRKKANCYNIQGLFMIFSTPPLPFEKNPDSRRQLIFTLVFRSQHHDQIVTGQDIGLSVRCSYDLQNRSVGQGIELAMALSESGDGDGAAADSALDGGGSSIGGGGAEETAFVISPTVMMRITNRAGGDIHAAQVGDPLSLRFHILDDRSPYEIFVRQLVALDGVDASEILLIDDDGCPTDPTIMGPISAVGDGGPSRGTVKILEAPFDAFKFPTSDIVQFKALVTPCLPKCEPINCNVIGHNGAVRKADSFGR